MMGCSDSKATDTNNKENAPQNTQKDQKDGIYVTEAEAIEYITNELGITEERAKKIVVQVDHNKDGLVSNDELKDMWGKIKEKRAEIKAEFEAMDADKSGCVTVEEAETVFNKRFKGLPSESIKAMVKRYDTEGQGKLRYDDFIYFYGNMVAKRESLELEYKKLDAEDKGDLAANDLERLLVEHCVLEEYMAKSLVDDCDINKDGVINRAEFQKLMSDMFT